MLAVVPTGFPQLSDSGFVADAPTLPWQPCTLRTRHDRFLGTVPATQAGVESNVQACGTPTTNRGGPITRDYL